MSLSVADIRRIAQLARLSVTEAEIAAVQHELNGILALVEQLKAADTAGIEPMAHAQDVMLRLREDVVTEDDQHRLFQSIAPRVEADLYLVPRVIE
ncbi:MAG TPA: Asp-tRNA(Asn)/Glu-tRNA(Gln) amidotransferase subunit GatC [Burkholderiales bacterium]|jgi:aspartyl-tRNA(Asn)/glutamyl-tRNA(Gln) amidotransferase subunit C|nr:Asp-tRNA(Asn)/Glu-tRNA(Gln) amidotransferase subunit GatC [Burkholderiales bacterium]